MHEGRRRSNNPASAYDVTVTPDGRNVYMATCDGALLQLRPRPRHGALHVRQLRRGRRRLHAADRRRRTSRASRSARTASNVYVRGHERARRARPPSSTGDRPEAGVRRAASTRATCANCTDVDGLAGRRLEDGRLAGRRPGLRRLRRDPGGIAIFNRDVRRDARPRRQAAACISADGVSGGAGLRCVDGNDGLATTYVVAVSPDGRSVYVGGDGGLTSYRRDRATALLTQTGCYGAVAGLHAGRRRARRRARPRRDAGRQRGRSPRALRHRDRSIVLPPRPGDGALTLRAPGAAAASRRPAAPAAA